MILYIFPTIKYIQKQVKKNLNKKTKIPDQFPTSLHNAIITQIMNMKNKIKNFHHCASNTIISINFQNNFLRLLTFPMATSDS